MVLQKVNGKLKILNAENIEDGNLHKIEFKPIGIVHSPFKECKGTPIQGPASEDAEGIVEIFPEFIEGLDDLDGFSHLILIFHLHLAKKYSLKVKPFLDDQFRGLFATRAPSRPNPIGLTIVELIQIDADKLYIKNFDMVDGTPLLDIKPFIPGFDWHTDVKTGWIENRIHNMETTKDDNRFGK